MCESLLSFHAFYKQTKYWKKDDRRAVREFEKSLRAMMRIVVNTMDRGDNTYNWNIQKFHEILHLPKQVREYGNICNTDAGFGERGLKFWAKRHGRRALKGNIEVFTASTINRVREHVCLRKAAYIVSSLTYTRNLNRDSSFHSNSSICTSDEYVYDTSDDSTSTGDDHTDDDSSCSSNDSSSDYSTQKSDQFCLGKPSESLDNRTCLSPAKSEQDKVQSTMFATRHKFVIKIERTHGNSEPYFQVSSTTMSYVVTKKHLILPRDIIDLYEAEFFSMEEEVGTKQSSKQLYETYRDTTIKVFTEAQLPNGDFV
jgi:hypothetical protein